MQDWLNTLNPAYLYVAAWLLTLAVGYGAHRYVFSAEAQLEAHLRERERQVRRRRQTIREMEDAEEERWQARLAAARNDFHTDSKR